MAAPAASGLHRQRRLHPSARVQLTREKCHARRNHYRPLRSDNRRRRHRLAARITLAHFSVSSAMSLPKSAGEPWSALLSRSANRAFILGSAGAALLSLLRLPTVSAGLFLAAPMPSHTSASSTATN